MARRRGLLPITAALTLTLLVPLGPPSAAAGPTRQSGPAAPAATTPAATAASATSARENAGAKKPTRTYTNPLDVEFDGNRAASCADPDVVRDPKSGDWFLYCTSDALTETPGADGQLTLHLLPTYSSRDLVHWTYRGDAVSERPSWVKSDAGMWAPDVVHHDGRWYLYFATPDTNVSGGGAAIGVLTGPSPVGPWTDSGKPVVAPSDQAGQPAGTRRSNIDPEVVNAGGKRYLFFGSYGGGLFARTLSADGTTTSQERQIAVTDRYEGSFVIKRHGWYYLLASATNCCNGPLTGYTVFAARSKNPLGPYRDRNGRSVLAGRVGGTPVLAQNGNRWVGTGHNTGLTDFDGQDWLIYHAVDRTDPYYAGNVGYTKRPALMDPLDWKNGWPTVRGGRGPSDKAMPAPAAQPGQRTSYRPSFVSTPKPGRRIKAASDEFSHGNLNGWSWVRKPDADTFAVRGGQLRWQTQAADIHPPSTPLGSVLTRPAPKGDFVVQTKVAVNTPANGCCQNYVQGGLLLYGGDGHYLKLTVTSIGATRQTEWGIENYPHPDGYPDYGNAVVGPVGSWTYLRIVADRGGREDHYTAYTSLDGRRWDRGATWTTDLGANPKIGLVSMGGAGFETRVDYVRTSRR